MTPIYPPFAPQSTGAIAPDDRLHYDGTYTCPICCHGQIQTLALMDTFGCNFCRHLFTANLLQQTVQVVDTAQPLGWRWMGHRWRSLHREDPRLTGLIWIIGVFLVVFPASLLWFASYLFPPLAGSTWSWFPATWVNLAFMSHLGLVIWLLVEHYQWPLYLWLKAQYQHWSEAGSRSGQAHNRGTARSRA